VIIHTKYAGWRENDFNVHAQKVPKKKKRKNSTVGLTHTEAEAAVARQRQQLRNEFGTSSDDE
jgi:hypothetical protein